MKFISVTFAAVVALATINCHVLPPFGEGPLYEDIQYFLDTIPMKDVSAVVLEYASEDKEFQALLEYFKTTEFKTMIEEIEAIPEFRDFAGYLQRNGVYIYDRLNALNKIIGLPPFHRTFAAGRRITGGLKGLFEDVKALVSYDAIIHGYVYKMRTSDAFRDFVARLKSADHQQFVNNLYDNRRFIHFRAMLVEGGIDVALIEDVIYTVLGIEFPIFNMPPALYAQNPLSKDIHDFIDLIDMNRIAEIVMSYLDDDGVERAVLYMRSEEFHVLVRQVEAMPEYQALEFYLEDAGLDVFGLIQKVHKMFEMEEFVPPKRNDKQISMGTFVDRGGVKGLVDAVIAALPMDKFKALYEEKMNNSPAFQKFMQMVRSDDFQKIVTTIYSSPIFLEMRQKALEAGLDLDLARKVIEGMLGIHLPVPSVLNMQPSLYAQNPLSKDIHDFIDLIDMNRIAEIVMSYLDDDGVERAVLYMRSEEFHVLVRQVEAMPEYQALEFYLEDAGLDVFGLIQKVHKMFEMEEFVPPKRNDKQISMGTFVDRGGVKGLVDAVIAALPMDKFKALYEEKMNNSPAFQKFMQMVRSDDFQKIVTTIYSSPIFLEMRQKALEAGLDLDLARKVIEGMLGIHLPVPSML